jgi:hypothetical protein
VIPDVEPDAPHELAARWIEEHRDATVPGLVLALRMPGDTAQMRVDDLLARLAAVEAVEPAMRTLKHPGANLAFHLAGRAVHLPVEVVARVGLPDAAIMGRLAALLDHPDFRCAGAAAWALASRAVDEACFAALWQRRDHRLEAVQFAVAHAAEIRADRTLVPALRELRARARESALYSRFDEVITALA